MANTSRPWGFRPVRQIGGAKWSGATTLYGHSASNSGTVFVGDVVQIDDTNRSTALTDAYAPGIPFIKAATASLTTTVFRGIVAGIVPQPEYNMTATASLGNMYVLASTARYVWVVDDPWTVFECEESGTNSYTSSSSNFINQLAEIGTLTSGSTTTGISGMTIVGSSGATTNLPFRVLRATQRIDNFSSTASTTTPAFHWDVQMANSDLATLKVGL